MTITRSMIEQRKQDFIEQQSTPSSASAWQTDRGIFESGVSFIEKGKSVSGHTSAGLHGQTNRQRLGFISADSPALHREHQK